MLKRKNSYLERRSSFHGDEFPSPQFPCLKSIAFTLPSTLHPLPAEKDIHLYTDDIYVPAASVGHNLYEKSSEI